MAADCSKLSYIGSLGFAAFHTKVSTLELRTQAPIKTSKEPAQLQQPPTPPPVK